MHIPKIIHYCWFGGNPIPEKLQKCLNTWSKLEGYEIMRWDESNCSFDENEFVRSTYHEKKLGHIGDYYRLKAVYTYGGIYLDTDVIVNRKFDDLLHYPCFIGFFLDCTLGTAVFGAQKGNQFVKELMNMYDNAVVGKTDNGMLLQYRNGKYIANDFFPTSNYFWTYYVLQNYPDVKLNNKMQVLDNFVILQKELLEIGKLTGKHYTIHLNDGVWREKKDSRNLLKNRIKELINPYSLIGSKIQIIIRKQRYRKLKKKNQFYKYSIAQKAKNKTD